MPDKKNIFTLYMPAPERESLYRAVERENARGAVPRLTITGVIRRLAAEWARGVLRKTK